MKKKLLVFLTIAAFLLLSSCGALMPDPEAQITSIEVTSIDDAAMTATITVSGTTEGSSTGPMTDYAGTIQLFNAEYYYDVKQPLTSSVSIEGSFTEVFEITFDGYGSYEVKAVLTDSAGETDSENIDVIIEEILPDYITGVAAEDISYLDDSMAPTAVEKTRESGTVWYKMVMNDEDADHRCCFHWADTGDDDNKWDTPAYTADISISIYKFDGTVIAENVDDGWWDSDEYASDCGPGSGIELTYEVDYELDETLYVKVSGTSGTFKFYTYCPGY